MTLEKLVKMAREVVENAAYRPTYCENPASFDPHDWVIEAMRRAYTQGRADVHREQRERDGIPTCVKCGSAECLRRALPCEGAPR